MADTAAWGVRLRVYPNPPNGKRSDIEKVFRWHVAEKDGDGKVRQRAITIGSKGIPLPTAPAETEFRTPGSR